MKKLFALMSCMILVAQYSMVSAQTTQTPKINIKKDGCVVQTYSFADIDSLAVERIEDCGNGVYKINGFEFVDLGLSVLWAKTNIGAAAETDTGKYYAWGETKPQDVSKFSWDTYKYGGENAETKYNATDNITVLEHADDAAYANWGTFCHMPSQADFNELWNNCTWTYTTMQNAAGEDVKGYKVTSKVDGNDNYIFLPMAGYCDKGVWNVGVFGTYPSTTLDTSNLNGEFVFTIKSDKIYFNRESRYVGRTVRAVAAKP